MSLNKETKPVKDSAAKIFTCYHLVLSSYLSPRIYPISVLSFIPFNKDDLEYNLIYL